MPAPATDPPVLLTIVGIAGTTTAPCSVEAVLSCWPCSAVKPWVISPES